MKKKRIILIAIVIMIVGGAWYGISEYNRKPADLKSKKADYSVKVTSLIDEFVENETRAGTRYFDKILEVNGIVKEINKNDKGDVTIILAREESMSSVRCSLDEIYKHDADELNPGEIITVKGAFTGFTSDELLGSDVFLNRCVIAN